MHTDTHKQLSEKPSLHCFQTISLQLTRQPGPAHLVLTRGFAVSVCCWSRDGAIATWRERCMEMCREARAMGRRTPAPLWAPEQQHLLTGWSSKRLAFLQQQGQWGGMRRHCHNQMQASWPSPRKGRHLLHLPKALFSKPQRTKWLRRRTTVGADPPISTGNPFLEMKTEMERGWAIFCPLQAEVRSSSSLSAAKKQTDI